MVAPFERGAQRLVAAQGRARPAGQELEARVELVADAAQAERRHCARRRARSRAAGRPGARQMSTSEREIVAVERKPRGRLRATRAWSSAGSAVAPASSNGAEAGDTAVPAAGATAPGSSASSVTLVATADSAYQRMQRPRRGDARNCRARGSSGDRASAPRATSASTGSCRALRMPSACAMLPPAGARLRHAGELDHRTLRRRSGGARACGAGLREPTLADAACTDDRDEPMGRARGPRAPRSARRARKSGRQVAGRLPAAARGASAGATSPRSVASSRRAVNRYPRPGTVAMAEGPMSLRSALT